MAINVESLELNRVYNFTPPEGEYPKCYGKCLLSRKNGSMLGLTQQEDDKFPHDVKFDARGVPERYDEKGIRTYDGTGEYKSREVGKQGWVRFSSFVTIE